MLFLILSLFKMALKGIHIIFKTFLVCLFISCSLLSFSQSNSLSSEQLKPDPDKEQKFLPYLAVRHGGMPAIENWKKNNTYLYYQELWYYCESFYVKRNYLNEGVTLNESIIDISRFESSRKENEEAIVTLPGYKDVLVLLPASKLVYSIKAK